MSSILNKIVEKKRLEVEATKRDRSISMVKALALEAAPALSLQSALSSPNSKSHIIAECKKKSPSKGVLCQDYQAHKIAQDYEHGGATAISVLTDQEYFGGHLEHLRAVKQTVSIPVLRKDFIIDEYQIWESRSFGADSFLLIAGLLDFASLQYFIEVGREIGMEPLVETHSLEDVSEALKTDARIIGVNCRNLETFSVDLNHAEQMYKTLQPYGEGRVFVCESGIKSFEDISYFSEIGYSAFLVGESLIKQQDKQKALEALIQKKKN